MICRWSAVFRRSDAMARGAVAGSGQARSAAAVSTGCGPISTSTLQFMPARVRTLLANCTGWRACLRQYAPSSLTLLPSASPVRLSIRIRCGAW
jgi:hypothetical protein